MRTGAGDKMRDKTAEYDVVMIRDKYVGGLVLPRHLSSAKNNYLL